MAFAVDRIYIYDYGSMLLWMGMVKGMLNSVYSALYHHYFINYYSSIEPLHCMLVLIEAYLWSTVRDISLLLSLTVLCASGDQDTQDGR